MRVAEDVFVSYSRQDSEKVQASFKDGVLTLRVPKREEAKPRTIAIQTH